MVVFTNNPRLTPHTAHSTAMQARRTCMREVLRLWREAGREGVLRHQAGGVGEAGPVLIHIQHNNQSTNCTHLDHHAHCKVGRAQCPLSSMMKWMMSCQQMGFQETRHLSEWWDWMCMRCRGWRPCWWCPGGGQARTGEPPVRLEETTVVGTVWPTCCPAPATAADPGPSSSTHLSTTAATDSTKLGPNNKHKTI